MTGPKIAKNAISGAQVKSGTLSTANLASSAQIQWAEVSATGQIIKSSGGITVSHPFTGGYYVHFSTSRLGHGVLTTVVWTGSKDVSSTVICSKNIQGVICILPFQHRQPLRVRRNGHRRRRHCEPCVLHHDDALAATGKAEAIACGKRLA